MFPDGRGLLSHVLVVAPAQATGVRRALRRRPQISAARVRLGPPEGPARTRRLRVVGRVCVMRAPSVARGPRRRAAATAPWGTRARGVRSRACPARARGHGARSAAYRRRSAVSGSTAPPRAPAPTRRRRVLARARGPPVATAPRGRRRLRAYPVRSDSLAPRWVPRLRARKPGACAPARVSVEIVCVCVSVCARCADGGLHTGPQVLVPGGGVVCRLHEM